MREKYEALIAKPVEIEATLREGAAKARKIATPFMAELRRAVGLCDLTHIWGTGSVQLPALQVHARGYVFAQPHFKQYREADGKFYFKLLDAEGALLLQSRGFDLPKAAGQRIVELKSGAALDDTTTLAGGVDAARVADALQALRRAEDETN
jgi:tryptophanyl-tRNA synthetase